MRAPGRGHDSSPKIETGDRVLVVDASALVEIMSADPAAPDLTRRIEQAEWLNAPDLIDYEVLNVLRKMVQRGDIDLAVAESSRTALRELRLVRHALNEESADRLWALRHNMSIYDAAYIALAERLDVPLVTMDLRLAAAATTLTIAAVEGYGP